MFIRTLHDSVINTDQVVLFTVEQAIHGDSNWMVVAHIHVQWNPDRVMAPSKFFVHQGPTKGECLAFLNSLLQRLNKE